MLRMETPNAWASETAKVPPQMQRCHSFSPVLPHPSPSWTSRPDGAPSHTKAPRGSTKPVDEDLEALYAFQ